MVKPCFLQVTANAFSLFVLERLISMTTFFFLREQELKPSNLGSLHEDDRAADGLLYSRDVSYYTSAPARGPKPEHNLLGREPTT